MKNILLINGILEALSGFILIFSPQLLLNNASPEIQGVLIAKLYGILALSFGIISYLLSKLFNFVQDTFKKIALVIIGFHLVVGLHMYSVYHQNITPHPGAAVLHISMAILFLLMYLKNMNHFNTIPDEPTS